MKVLLVSYTDSLGGAGKAAYRLHQGLLERGVDSWMLVLEKATSDERVVCPFSPLQKCLYRRKKHLVQVLMAFVFGWREYRSYNLFPSFLHAAINRFDADVVNLHWVNGEMISLGSIRSIESPIVWTLHDRWLFLGSRHHEAAPGVRDSWLRRTVDAALLRRKKRMLARKRVWLATPSRWLMEAGLAGDPGEHAQVSVIHNGVDPSVFMPRDKRQSRKILGLPADRRLILCGAAALDSEFKGINALREASQLLRKKLGDGAELVLFGGGMPSTPDKSAGGEGLPTRWLGTVDDDETLARLYSAADVFVLPSRIENYPNTVIEAAACGLSCVGFSVGGVPEQIVHLETGYLAEPENAGDLADGVTWVLQQDAEQLGARVRGHAVERFSLSRMAEEYEALFAHLAFMEPMA